MTQASDHVIHVHPATRTTFGGALDGCQVPLIDNLLVGQIVHVPVLSRSWIVELIEDSAVFLLEALFVALITSQALLDVEISSSLRLALLHNFDVRVQRVMAERVGVRIWLAVGQILEDESLVIIGDQAALFHGD